MKGLFMLCTFMISVIMGYAILLAVNHELSILDNMFNGLGFDIESSLSHIKDYLDCYPYKPYYG